MAYAPAPDRYERMPYRNCGNSGLKLPALSLGAAFDTIGGRMGFEKSRETLLTAFDLGITHFDLANNYGTPAGNAETVVGKVLKEIPRDEVIVSTKAGFRMWPGPYGAGLSRKHLIASLDQSLKRLDQDYVDLFYAHTPDGETPLEETLRAFQQILQQGKALYVGVSNFDHNQFEEAQQLIEQMGGPEITIHQTPYNILARGAEGDLFDRLDIYGTGCAAFYVLGQGVLTGKYSGGTIPPGSRVDYLWKEADKKVGLAPRAMEQIERLSGLARERGQTLAQLCIAWVLRDPIVTTAIVGASSPEQVRENVRLIEKLEFTDEELAQIDAISPVPEGA